MLSSLIVDTFMVHIFLVNTPETRNLYLSLLKLIDRTAVWCNSQTIPNIYVTWGMVWRT